MDAEHRPESLLIQTLALLQPVQRVFLESILDPMQHINDMGLLWTVGICRHYTIQHRNEWEKNAHPAQHPRRQLEGAIRLRNKRVEHVLREGHAGRPGRIVWRKGESKLEDCVCVVAYIQGIIRQ